MLHEQGILTALYEKMKYEKTEVKREVIWAIANTSRDVEASTLQEMVSEGLLGALLIGLQSTSQHII